MIKLKKGLLKQPNSIIVKQQNQEKFYGDEKRNIP